MPTATPQKKETEKMQPVNGKEVLLLVLVAILGALAIYTSRDDHTAFGLVDSIAYAQQQPVVTVFHSEVLASRQMLELNADAAPQKALQVLARVEDPSNPAPAEYLTALNTRIGGEILLTWQLPTGVELVNVYRRAADETVETLVAKQVRGTVYLDASAKNGVEYQYTARTVAEYNGETFESSTALSATAIASDTIPPYAPMNVIATAAIEDGVPTVSLAWENPADADLDSIVIYRSDELGTRGEAIATLTPQDAPVYTDATVERHVEYAYTIVAVDAAGNSSAGDFSVPVTGNASPFSPLIAQ